MAVDGQRHGLTHAQVAERVPVERLAVLVGQERQAVGAGVGQEKHHAVGGAAKDRDRGVGAEALDVVGRDVLHQVDVAGQQRGLAGGVVADHADEHAGVGRFDAPVVVVALERHALAVAEADEPVGSGADGDTGAAGLRRLAGQVRGDDEDVGELAGEGRVRTVRVDQEGVGVDDLEPGDRAQVAVVGTRVVGQVADPGKARDDVICGERGAVVEADVAAELEFPGLRIELAPAFGEGGRPVDVGVAAHEGVEDVAGGGHVGAEEEVVRVEQEGGLHAHSEFLCHRAWGEKQDRDEGAKQHLGQRAFSSGGVLVRLPHFAARPKPVGSGL